MKVAIETLGCKVNFYESEVIKGIFLENNYQIVTLDENPDVVVINTCSVTNQSDAKDRKIIRKAKRENPNSIIIVCGCYTQQDPKELDSLDIDIILGNKDKTQIVTLLEEYLKNKTQIKKIYNLDNIEFEEMQIAKSYDRTRAFVKIEDGCDNYCSYCIIPYVRGNVRFKDYDSAYNEIKSLVEDGFKEIVLTGIHTGRYPNLTKLIHEISKLDGLERIRISSIEITEINNEEFLNELKNNPKLCKHMHIPVQSAENNTLKMMNRKYTIEEFSDIINKIRSIKPEINITTDLIVGFPTETEEEFNECIKNAEKLKFGKIHVFPYSKRNGTAASKMKNVVSDKQKDERTHLMLALSDKLEKEYYQKYIGKEIKVLAEEFKDGYTYGYSDNYLRIKINHNIPKGTIVKVKITSLDNLTLVGDLL